MMTWWAGSRISTTAVAPAATSTRTVTCRASMMPTGMVYGVTTARMWELPIAASGRVVRLASAGLATTGLATTGLGSTGLAGAGLATTRAPVASLPDPGGPDRRVGQERSPDHHEQQRQPGFRAVLGPARPDQDRQADDQGGDQGERGQVMQLLVGVPHDQDAHGRGEHQGGGQAQQDVRDDPLGGHSHRSRNRTKTSPLPNRSTASSTGSSNSPGRRNPSASSTSTMTTIELIAS